MGYIYTAFGGLQLPLDGATQDLSTPDPYAATVNLANGGSLLLYDPADVPGGATDVTVHGVLNRRAGLPDLQVQLDAWLGKARTVDRLYRVGDTRGDVHWITALLKKVKPSRDVTLGPFQLPVDFTFTLLDKIWTGEAHGPPLFFDQSPTIYFDTGLYFDGTALWTLLPDPTVNSVSLVNNGTKAQSNVLLTFLPNGVNCTWLEVTGGSGVGIWHWRYTGTILAGQQLTVDAGAETVSNNGVDAYRDFTQLSDIQIAEWVRLLPGGIANPIAITWTPSVALTGTMTMTALYGDGQG